jgi:hypothetical protein
MVVFSRSDVELGGLWGSLGDEFMEIPLIPQPLLVLRGFRLRQPQALALHAQAWEKGGRSANQVS